MLVHYQLEKLPKAGPRLDGAAAAASFRFLAWPQGSAAGSAARAAAATLLARMAASCAALPFLSPLEDDDKEKEEEEEEEEASAARLAMAAAEASTLADMPATVGFSAPFLFMYFPIPMLPLPPDEEDPEEEDEEEEEEEEEEEDSAQFRVPQFYSPGEDLRREDAAAAKSPRYRRGAYRRNR